MVYGQMLHLKHIDITSYKKGLLRSRNRPKTNTAIDIGQQKSAFGMI